MFWVDLASVLLQPRQGSAVRNLERPNATTLYTREAGGVGWGVLQGERLVDVEIGRAHV